MPAEWTIDELAREIGMTVRNIRAHQARGLLPAPEVRARTGYYGPDHVARLRLIQDMQAEGFNLKAIQRLLEGPEGAGEEALRFGRTLSGAFAEEEPELVTVDDLRQRLGTADERVLRKAVSLGFVRPLGEDRYEVPSPTLLRAGEQLVALGIPVSHVLAVGERVERHSRAIADAYVRLFLQDVVGKGAHERSADDWSRLRDTLERLRPLATETVLAGFQLAMSRAVERELERTLQP